MQDFTPRQIVKELDKYIVGQDKAKRALAVALRNRYRRQQLPPEIRDEVMPKNLMLIGPTGVGKTELARRLSKLVDAPFIKVEATKFTEVGYVGHDVESIVRELVETSVNMVHMKAMDRVKEEAEKAANERLINYLVRQSPKYKVLQEELESLADSEQESAAASTKKVVLERKMKRQRKRMAQMLAERRLDDEIVEIEVDPDPDLYSVVDIFADIGDSDEAEDAAPLFSLDQSNRKRSRKVSVAEARRILVQEEAQKMIDFDAVIDEGVQKAEQDGIVFIDEIDKLISNGYDSNADVSGEGVQRDLLPIVEGSNVVTRYGTVKTDHILFIAAGAFHDSKPSDLIPELQGRFPLRVELEDLDAEDLKAILVEPDNSLIKQYQALLGTEGVELEFTPDGIDEIARFAHEMNLKMENIGARRLQTVMERVLEDVAFDATDLEDKHVRIDRAYVKARLENLIENEDLSRFIL